MSRRHGGSSPSRALDAMVKGRLETKNGALCIDDILQYNMIASNKNSRTDLPSTVATLMIAGATPW